MMTTEAPDGTTGASGRGRWVQMGLLTAGAAAPLIARWRALRAAERAEALREQASGRWNDAMSWAAQSLPPDGIQDAIQGAIQGAIHERLPQAQESIRQVSAAARDALRRLPLSSAAEPPAPVAAPTPVAVSSRRANAALWALGVGVGVVAAGAIAYVVLRNRMNAARDDDDMLVEIPLTAAAAPVTPGPRAQAQTTPLTPDTLAIAEDMPVEEPSEAEPLAFDPAEGADAAYVGNILTRVYHPADSMRLPVPQHRIYFATRAEADEAGYRPDASEPAPHGSDATRLRD